jgi:hypothetical protein
MKHAPLKVRAFVCVEKRAWQVRRLGSQLIQGFVPPITRARNFYGRADRCDPSSDIHLTQFPRNARPDSCTGYSIPAARNCRLEPLG